MPASRDNSKICFVATMTAPPRSLLAMRAQFQRKLDEERQRVLEEHVPQVCLPPSTPARRQTCPFTPTAPNVLRVNVQAQIIAL